MSTRTRRRPARRPPTARSVGTLRLTPAALEAWCAALLAPLASEQPTMRPECRTAQRERLLAAASQEQTP